MHAFLLPWVSPFTMLCLVCLLLACVSPYSSRSDKEATTCSRANEEEVDCGIFSVVEEVECGTRSVAEDVDSDTCSLAKVLECVSLSLVKEVDSLSRSLVKELDSASGSEMEDGGCPGGLICGKYIR